MKNPAYVAELQNKLGAPSSETLEGLRTAEGLPSIGARPALRGHRAGRTFGGWAAARSFTVL